MADHWDGLPDNLRPTTVHDSLTLDEIGRAVRQAVMIRHDFQRTLAVEAGLRRLPPNKHARRAGLLDVFESDFAQGGTRTAGDLAQKHTDIENDVRSKIATLNNAVLRELLKARIKRLFPPIGSPKKGESLKRLRGLRSVLDHLPPVLGAAEEDDVVRLLLRPAPAQDAHYF